MLSCLSTSCSSSRLLQSPATRQAQFKSHTSTALPCGIRLQTQILPASSCVEHCLQQDLVFLSCHSKESNLRKPTMWPLTGDESLLLTVSRVERLNVGAMLQTQLPARIHSVTGPLLRGCHQHFSLHALVPPPAALGSFIHLSTRTLSGWRQQQKETE